MNHNYAWYWAADVVREFHHDEYDESAVEWVLAWMKRSNLDPEGFSTIQGADMMASDWLRKIEKIGRKNQPTLPLDGPQQVTLYTCEKDRIMSVQPGLCMECGGELVARQFVEVTA